jgi:G3E family GTPase
MARSPIPLTLLTGFLGGGKTTVLNRILRDPGGRSVGVLVNDFGDLPVDGMLVESVDEDTIVFAGGCLCCQMRDDVPRAVHRLLDRADRPDHILVEVSGVANPFEAAKPFAALAPAIAVDAVVGVIDAERLVALAQPDGSIDWADLAIDHVMAADIVILNKVDLIPDRLPLARRIVRDAVGRARLLEAVRGNVATELVLGVGAALPHAEGGRGHRHAEYESWSFAREQPLSLEAFRRMVRELPTAVIRAKGVIYAAEQPETRHIFQLVGTRATVEAGGAWAGEPRTAIVVIGQRGALDVAELERSFDSTRAAAGLVASTREPNLAGSCD